MYYEVYKFFMLFFKIFGIFSIKIEVLNKVLDMLKIGGSNSFSENL